MVPRSTDASENDGWVMSLVYDPETDRSELQVRDAAVPTELVATVKLPVRVPAGFHGNWIPDPS
jgi:carotenoid cleavage dioxygenase